MSKTNDPSTPASTPAGTPTGARGRVIGVYKAIESVESKVWWGPIVRGLLAVGFAVWIMVANTGQDNTAIKAAVLLVGIFALVNGVIAIVCAIIDKGTSKGPVFFGLLSAVVGIVLMAWPADVAKIAVVIFGVFVVAVGSSMTYSGFKLKSAAGSMNGLLITGPILILLGIVIAFTPLFWAKLIIWLLAIMLAVFGIVLIAIGFSIRKALKDTTVVAVG